MTAGHRRAVALAGIALLCAAFVAGAQTQECVWTNVGRVVAVGDVHGDCDRFVEALRLAGVVNEKNAWIAGKTHLVQVGDVPDRGPDTRKAMDLLRRLEKEAEAAGGRVHALIGNHEAMVVKGDIRYASDEDMAAFGGKDGFLAAMGPDGEYGKWIGTHNTVIRINDTLFVHGGIGPGYAKLSLQEINDAVRGRIGVSP